MTAWGILKFTERPVTLRTTLTSQVWQVQNREVSEVCFENISPQPIQPHLAFRARLGSGSHSQAARAY